MLLESDKEEIRTMIKEAAADALKESRSEIEESVKSAILGARNTQKPTREQILKVKNRTERQRLIQENMDLFKEEK